MEQGHRESKLIMTFTSYAHRVLCISLGNISTFNSKVQFVMEIDRVALSHQ